MRPTLLGPSSLNIWLAGTHGFLVLRFVNGELHASDVARMESYEIDPLGALALSPGRLNSSLVN